MYNLLRLFCRFLLWLMPAEYITLEPNAALPPNSPPNHPSTSSVTTDTLCDHQHSYEQCAPRTDSSPALAQPPPLVPAASTPPATPTSALPTAPIVPPPSIDSNATTHVVHEFHAQPAIAIDKYDVDGSISAETWIDQFVAQMTATRVPQSLWYTFVSANADIRVFKWVKARSEATLTNWAEFRRAFVNAFGMAPNAAKRNIELFQLHPNQFPTFARFMIEIQSKLMEFPVAHRPNEFTLMDYVFKALPHSITNKLRLSDFANFGELYDAVIPMDEAKAAPAAPPVQAYFGPTSTPHTSAVTTMGTFRATSQPNDACFACGSREHRATDKLCCRYCKQLGHTLQNCPLPTCKASRVTKNAHNNSNMQVDNTQRSGN